MTDKEAETRMTACIHQVEESVYEADFTIEPTEAEARTWLQRMAGDRSVARAESAWSD